MSIILNDNIKINAGKPSEAKYLSTGNTVYSSISAVTGTTGVPIAERHVGLTVNINNVEYWFKDGVTDVDLIEKKYDSTIPTEDFVTGATNIGFFSGFTGVQTLTISTLNLPPLINYLDYIGNYDSLYNWFFRGDDGAIHVGLPNDGILKRGYVLRPNLPTAKSWIWNEYTGGTNLVGWILINGNINNMIGAFQNGVVYYTGASKVYTQTAWTIPDANGSSVAINNVSGSLTTGNTLTIGGPVYAYQEDNDLHFRTIKTKTPEIIDIEYDEAFVYVNASSDDLDGQNVGTGSQVFSGRTGDTFIYRTIKGSGDTIVSQTDDEVVIYSSGGTGTVTYDLESPAAIEVGGIEVGTILTGKTSFELFEELLVPVLYPTLTAPTRTFVKSSPSATYYEIDSDNDIVFDSTFNQGSINPQYTALSDKRSGLPSAYNYTGAGLPSTYPSASIFDTQTSVSYTTLIGLQDWTGNVTYGVGVQPKDSKGNDYDSPYPAGTTASITRSIEGVYPLFATTTNIATLTKQTLVSMLNANNIVIDLIAESGGNKQKFDIPDNWIGSPTNRVLDGVEQYNTVSFQWEYPGGSAVASLALWDVSSTTQVVQGNTINYTRYTYNGTDRSAVQIRLVF